MDILAHGLWSNIALYKKYPQNGKKRLIAVLFGVFPDIIPFVPSFIYLIFNRTGFDMYAALYSTDWVFVWAREAYNYTHSFVIFAAVAGIIWAARREFYWPMVAWGIHIALDLFTHPDFFNTPFLFPLSDYKITFGLSWGHSAIMIPQYSFFAVWFLWYFLKRKRRVAAVVLPS